MSCKLLSQVADGVATLAFNRPEVYNALDEKRKPHFRGR
jgi:enoyl-CoA hydratase/carnithine racemase